MPRATTLARRQRYQVIWSEQAEGATRWLPEDALAAVRRKLEYVAAMPRMYAAAQDERFPGCRSFWVDPAYRVYYMVAATGGGVYVTAIVEEPVDEALEETG
jgi:hypothetical protein